MRKSLNVAIIGRTEVLYDTTLALVEAGHKVTCILTSKEAPEYKRKADDFRRLASDLGVAFAQGATITAYRDFLSNAGADIGVSFNYTGVLPQDIIDLFPLGVLNAHGGDLPRYRGNACQAWAILNGESRIGLCVHRMIGGELDSGDIVARDFLPIDRDTKVTKAWVWMEHTVPVLMRQAVDRLAEDPHYVLERQSKDPLDALRCYPRKPEDGRIDWRRSALDILRLINASNKPYPGAFCELEGMRITVWDAELLDDEERFLAIPGQVTAVSQDHIDVACGEGKIRIHKVQVSEQPECAPGRHIISIRQRLS